MGSGPRKAVRVKRLPGGAAVLLAVLAGVLSAVQSAVNAELGARVGSGALGAAVNHLGGCVVIAVGFAVLPSMRSGLRVLRHARLPWWAYLGGVGGALLVTAATYVVPVLGVAVFTIAQVAGNSVGGLAVDRVGLGPAGRLALSGPRVAGALLGIAAVAMAQIGRPVGQLAVGLVLLAMAGGLGVALQAALNARVSAASSMATGTAVNFAVGTPLVLAAAAALGGLDAATSGSWPSQWYLYLGGLFGVSIVTLLIVTVPAVGVLRVGLSTVGGQLVGAMLLDALLPSGPGVRPMLVVGAVLTFLAVIVSGRSARSRASEAAPARR